ncbi:unnamed protein product [Tuber aestivum]|uniref:Uncharacterized protein n=1 Tax=Tuber aestivum TaxID=59557 RepID=A0A292PXF1_9PEZI|nr:unnamed protein product [Tuber aestivum]
MLRPAEDSKGKKTPAKNMPLLGDRFKKRSPGGRPAADSVTKPDVPGGRGVGVKALSGAGHGRDEIFVDDGCRAGLEVDQGFRGGEGN